MQKLPFIYIADSALGGRGVFTSEMIPIGTLIEIAPVIVLPPNDLKLIHEHTFLHDYYFVWSDDGEEGALALGYGSLYNHSYSPNAEYYTNRETMTIDVFAIRDIDAGEEITFNYNGMPHDSTAVWFDDPNYQR
jgi:SET domain-containing protein